MGFADSEVVRAIGISGSPSARSRSRALLERTLAYLAERGVRETVIDLATLPAESLLGRRHAAEVDAALEQVAAATIVVVSTPVYRATYSGLLKVFFDLLPQSALVGKVGIPIATGGAPGHQLVIDYGLRPLFASVGAAVVPTGIYGVDADFASGVPRAALLDRVERAAVEAIALADARASRTPLTTPTPVEG